jgi:polyhydroxybutyrate depolymerase
MRKGLCCAVLLLGCGSDGGSSKAPDAAVIDATSMDAAVADASDAAPPDAAMPDAAPAPDLGVFGGDRPARVVLPANHDPAQKWPLIVLLHGYRANGTLIDRQLHLSDRVDADGFVLVIPEGTPDDQGFLHWNAHGDPAPDDVAYLSGLVDEAVARFNVDRGRVYVVGHSNGGYMAYKLACRVPGLVTAIAPISGSLDNREAACADGPPVAVLHLHGDADNQVEYAGTDGYPGAEEVTARWVARNHCGMPTDSGPFDLDRGVPGPETSVRSWSGCDAGADIELWHESGVGHLVTPTPEGTRRLVEFLLRHHRDP